MSGTARGIHSGVDTLPRRGTSVTPKSVGDRSLEYLRGAQLSGQAWTDMERHGTRQREYPGYVQAQKNVFIFCCYRS